MCLQKSILFRRTRLILSLRRLRLSKFRNKMTFGTVIRTHRSSRSSSRPMSSSLRSSRRIKTRKTYGALNLWEWLHRLSYQSNRLSKSSSTPRNKIVALLIYQVTTSCWISRKQALMKAAWGPRRSKNRESCQLARVKYLPVPWTLISMSMSQSRHLY